MNQPFQELAERAGFKLIRENCYDVVSTMSVQEFAELIVQECTTAVMDGTKEGDHYAQRIEQYFANGTGGILHFGVEE